LASLKGKLNITQFVLYVELRQLNLF
jgi:hypothetical protein